MEEAGFLAHVEQARRRGIRLYPVAANGVGRKAKVLLRQAAQATLARYVFLTDDSGIGGGHAEPHIPCYQVQRLDAVPARVLVSELTGPRAELQGGRVGTPGGGGGVGSALALAEAVWSPSSRSCPAGRSSAAHRTSRPPCDPGHDPCQTRYHRGDPPLPHRR